MATFNDLVTLLLTFFVLLLSTSKLNVAKVKEASFSFSNTSGFLDDGGIIDVNVFKPFVQKLLNPESLEGATSDTEKKKFVWRINNADEFSEKTVGKAPDGEKNPMYARLKASGISAVLPEKMLFRSGMAEIEDKNNPALKALCAILRETGCRIKVEGHTDDIPIHNGRFASNWELSTARAVTILKYLVSEGGISPQRLSAAAYADSRPISPNTNNRRRELNRRVEVVLMLDNKEHEDG